MHWKTNPLYITTSIWGEAARRRFKKMRDSEVHGYVKKTWGSELWFANNDLYCGKLLTVESGKWSSEGKYHYHKIKDETFFVIEGRLWLDIGDDKTGEYQRLHLYANDSYRVMPGVKHRFTASSSFTCKFIEASTHHDDEDSYRCYYDEKKEKWIDG